jgi:hypothetical protein
MITHSPFSIGYIYLTMQQQGRLPNSSVSTERLTVWNYKGSRTEDKFNPTICTLIINITQLSLNKPYITTHIPINNVMTEPSCTLSKHILHSLYPLYDLSRPLLGNLK